MRRAVSKNILIIDDDDDLRDIIHFALADRGHSVRSFANPEKALTFLNMSEFIPDLIIVDQFMKDMTGGEFLEIKGEHRNPSIRNCPSVIISGSPQDVERSVDRKLYTEIVPKPLDMDEISLRVEELLSDSSERSLRV